MSTITGQVHKVFVRSPFLRRHTHTHAHTHAHHRHITHITDTDTDTHRGGLCAACHLVFLAVEAKAPNSSTAVLQVDGAVQASEKLLHLKESNAKRMKQGEWRHNKTRHTHTHTHTHTHKHTQTHSKNGWFMSTFSFSFSFFFVDAPFRQMLALAHQSHRRTRSSCSLCASVEGKEGSCGCGAEKGKWRAWFSAFGGSWFTAICHVDTSRYFTFQIGPKNKQTNTHKQHKTHKHLYLHPCQRFTTFCLSEL